MMFVNGHRVRIGQKSTLELQIALEYIRVHPEAEVVTVGLDCESSIDVEKRMKELFNREK